MLPNHVSQLEPVDLRHADVHQHNGNVILKKEIERLAARRRLDEILPELAENRFVAEKFPRLVVDHQNVDWFECAHPGSRSIPRSNSLCNAAAASDATTCEAPREFARY